MAKNKELERLYYIEGRIRINKRYLKRREKGIQKRQYKRSSASWPDSNSPTGYSQNCSYQGICQSPCNGDC